MSTSPFARRGWRVALPALVIALVAVLLLFRETAMAMAAIWARSDTYAHGMLVPPIALWLTWRIRPALAALAPRSSYLAIVLLAGTGFVWLIGELAAVNALTQFALVAMLALVVPAVAGWTVARRMAFPLFFLFFAVPFGDFTQPKLMEWTAQATVLGLRLSGIPVFHEGQHLVIPSGNWSVVEACSGVRYLIASVTVGTLFAYLTYHSLMRRVLFIAVSIVVPIVANWLRAYMIVMLGHLSGNRLAVGVDHLIYGWVFFGVVILAMFWIGARWREDDRPQATASSAEGAEQPSLASFACAALVTILSVAIWPMARLGLDRPTVPQASRIAPLGPIAGWQQAAGDAPGDWRPAFQGYVASSQTSFERDGQVVGVFLAYYQNQGENRKLVSTSNALVLSDDPLWARVGGGAPRIAFAGLPDLEVRSADLRETGGPGLRVWQWYWIGGRWTASDALAKAWTALSRLAGRGDDSAVIIVFTERRGGGEADASLAAFTSEAGGAIAAALEQTRGLR